MSKTHLIDKKRLHPFKCLHSSIYWEYVVCGREVINPDATDNPDKVTCKNCLRVWAKREREKERDENRNDAQPA